MSFFEKLEALKEEYLFLKYLLSNLNDYKNIGLNFPVGIVLVLFAIALPVSFFFINKRNNDLAFALKQLLRHDAISEKNAKSLKNLRLDNRQGIKRMLSSSGRLSSIVKIRGIKKPSYEEYMALSKEEKKRLLNQKLDECDVYIEENRKSEAESIASRGTSSLLKPLILSLASIFIIGALFISSPEILEFINERLGE